MSPLSLHCSNEIRRTNVPKKMLLQRSILVKKLLYVNAVFLRFYVTIRSSSHRMRRIATKYETTFALFLLRIVRVRNLIDVNRVQ